jgi:hypothetical protein
MQHFQWSKDLLPVLFAAALALGAGSFAARAMEVTAELDAVNRILYADRQSTLTQQIARNACFVMAGIEPAIYAGKTDSVVRQFDTTLNGLRQGDPNLGLRAEQDPEVLKQLGEVEILWSTLGPAARQISAGDLHSVPMRQLVRYNTATLGQMDSALKSIVSAYGHLMPSEDLARTLGLAGRQRMLSQRASKEICFYNLGLEFAADRSTVLTTMENFSTAMQILIEGDAERGILAPPTPQLRKQLERTSKVWQNLQALVLSLDEKGQLTDGERIKLANMSDQVLREMELVVSMYIR